MKRIDTDEIRDIAGSYLMWDCRESADMLREAADEIDQLRMKVVELKDLIQGISGGEPI